MVEGIVQAGRTSENDTDPDHRDSNRTEPVFTRRQAGPSLDVLAHHLHLSARLDCVTGVLVRENP